MFFFCTKPEARDRTIEIRRLLILGGICAFVCLVLSVFIFLFSSPNNNHLPPLSETGVFPFGREFFSVFGVIFGSGVMILGYMVIYFHDTCVFLRIRSFLGFSLMLLCVFPIHIWVDEKYNSRSSLLNWYMENRIFTVVHLAFTCVFFIGSFHLYS